MLFKDLKQGFTVYTFDKGKMEYKQGRVVSVSDPHIDKNINTSIQMVVDVIIDIDCNNKPFVFYDNAETGYSGTLIISSNKDVVVREIEATKNQSEEILNKIDYHKDVVEKCSSILADINPALKEKKQMEDRMNKLESSLSSINDAIRQLLESKNNPS